MMLVRTGLFIGDCHDFSLTPAPGLPPTTPFPTFPILKDMFDATGTGVTRESTSPYAHGTKNTSIDSNGATTSIKAVHLSDHPGMWERVHATYSVGQTIKNVVVVAKEGATERLLLSAKPSFQTAVKDGLVPCDSFEGLEAGQEHIGYVRSVTPYGCFVGLFHGMVGLVNIKHLATRFIDNPRVNQMPVVRLRCSTHCRLAAT